MVILPTQIPKPILFSYIMLHSLFLSSIFSSSQWSLWKTWGTKKTWSLWLRSFQGSWGGRRNVNYCTQFGLASNKAHNRHRGYTSAYKVSGYGNLLLMFSHEDNFLISCTQVGWAWNCLGCWTPWKKWCPQSRGSSGMCWGEVTMAVKTQGGQVDWRRGPVDGVQESARRAGSGRNCCKDRCLMSWPEPGRFLMSLCIRSAPSECPHFIHCDDSKSREGREPWGPK